MLVLIRRCRNYWVFNRYGRRKLPTKKSVAITCSWPRT